MKLFDDGLSCWKKNNHMLSIKDKYRDIHVNERIAQEFCFFYTFRGFIIGNLRNQADFFVYSGFYGEAE